MDSIDLKKKLLARELTVLACHAAMDSYVSGEPCYDHVWNDNAEDLQDTFPDIERIAPIDKLHEMYLDEARRRYDLIDMVMTPDGIDRIYMRVLKVASWFLEPVNGINIRATFDETYGHELHADYFAEKLALFRRSFTTWFCGLDDNNQLNFARMVRRYGRNKCQEVGL